MRVLDLRSLVLGLRFVHTHGRAAFPGLLGQGDFRVAWRPVQLSALISVVKVKRKHAPKVNQYLKT